MEVGQRDGALAGGPATWTLASSAASATHMSDGWVAMQDSLVPRMACMRLMPAMRGAAAARLALIAGRRGVVEVRAARALQEIAAGRGHVAQLRRSAGEDRARQQRIALGDQRVVGEVGIRHQRADAQAAVRGLLDGLERQPRNVDQPRRPLDVLLHQIDQVGAAGDEFRRGVGGDQADRVGDVVGAGIVEIDHDRPIARCMACSIAATMLG